MSSTYETQGEHSAALASRPSVAIVDDDSGFANYLRTFLSLRGYESRCYTRGDELLASMKQTDPPDVVLLDVMMPGLDGIEVARRLRAGESETGRLPILMLTAKDDVSDRESRVVRPPSGPG